MTPILVALSVAGVLLINAGSSLAETVDVSFHNAKTFAIDLFPYLVQRFGSV